MFPICCRWLKHTERFKHRRERRSRHQRKRKRCFTRHWKNEMQLLKNYSIVNHNDSTGCYRTDKQLLKRPSYNLRSYSCGWRRYIHLLPVGVRHWMKKVSGLVSDSLVCTMNGTNLPPADPGSHWKWPLIWYVCACLWLMWPARTLSSRPSICSRAAHVQVMYCWTRANRRALSYSSCSCCVWSMVVSVNN